MVELFFSCKWFVFPLQSSLWHEKSYIPAILNSRKSHHVCDVLQVVAHPLGNCHFKLTLCRHKDMQEDKPPNTQLTEHSTSVRRIQKHKLQWITWRTQVHFWGVANTTGKPILPLLPSLNPHTKTHPTGNMWGCYTFKLSWQIENSFFLQWMIVLR